MASNTRNWTTDRHAKHIYQDLLSFWLAQFLIVVFTIFITIRQFESMAAAYTSSFAMMQNHGETVTQRL